MRPVAPRTGEPEVTIAEEQHEYLPITAAVRDRVVNLENGGRVRVRSLVTRWTLTPEERQQVSAGADVYVELLTGGRPMQPVAVGLEPGP